MPRDYAKITHRFWHGKTGRLLREKYPDAHRLAAYLIGGCREGNMIGLYFCTIQQMGVEAGLYVDQPEAPLQAEMPKPFRGMAQGVHAALATLEEHGFCVYDREACYVWVTEAAKYQTSEQLSSRSDKRWIGVCNLLRAAQEDVPDIVAQFVNKYEAAFRLSGWNEVEGSSHDSSGPPSAAPLQDPSKAPAEGSYQAPSHDPSNGSSQGSCGASRAVRADRTGRAVKAAAVARVREPRPVAPAAPAAAAGGRGGGSVSKLPPDVLIASELEDADTDESHPIRQVFDRYEAILVSRGLRRPSLKYVGRLIARCVLFWRSGDRDPAEELLAILDYCEGSNWVSQHEAHGGFPPERIFGAMKFAPDRLQEQLARAAHEWRLRSGPPPEEPATREDPQPAGWDECPRDARGAQEWLSIETKMLACELAQRAGTPGDWKSYREPARHWLFEVIGQPPADVEQLLAGGVR